MEVPLLGPSSPFQPISLVPPARPNHEVTAHAGHSAPVVRARLVSQLPRAHTVTKSSLRRGAWPSYSARLSLHRFPCLDYTWTPVSEPPPRTLRSGQLTPPPLPQHAVHGGTPSRARRI
jgi:hypothetical protein